MKQNEHIGATPRFYSKSEVAKSARIPPLIESRVTNFVLSIRRPGLPGGLVTLPRGGVNRSAVNAGAVSLRFFPG